MTLVEIALSVGKIAFFLLFLLNLAALCTWADRRQSAMVQDRVGPNRAVIYAPSIVVKVLLAAPAGLVAAFAAAGLRFAPDGRAATETIVVAFQIAAFMGWSSLLVLRAVVKGNESRNGLEEALVGTSPQSIFYGGLMVHGLGLLLGGATPAASAQLVARISLAVLVAVASAVGIYAASRVPDGKIGIRLAGTLHALADAIKLVWKEDFVPPNADKLLHSLAPLMAMFPALVTCAVIPFGATLCFGDNGDGQFGFADLGNVAPVMAVGQACSGYSVSLQIADLNVGILYLFGVAGTGVIGAAIAGWSSDNKFSLLGGLRAASQMVSYEVAMGLSLIGLFMIYGSVRMGDMVAWQAGTAWGVFVQPLAFVIFLTALAAETKRVPFDQPEGESEIVSGYFVEYSGMKFGMFMTGEYIELVVSSALLVTLFFGGYHMPFMTAEGVRVTLGDTLVYAYPMTHVAVVVLSVLAFCVKVVLMTFVQIFVRWTLPRFRYDQVMKLGWTKLLPLSIANMLITGVVVLGVDSGGPGVQKTLKLAADLTHLLVGAAMLIAVVAFVRFMLQPSKRTKFLGSTATKLAEAAGGTQAEPMQA
jgi:NADH-quinone oxidoreductase subunit H